MMTRHEEIRQEAAAAGRDPRTRKVMLALGIVALLSFLTAILAGYTAWNDADEEADAGQSLAEQVQAACEDRSIDTEDLEKICSNAKELSEDDPEIQDAEFDDPDPDDPEVQDPEVQDPEVQDAEQQDRERQDGEVQDGDLNDPDPVDDPDPNDPDPVDDPDPNDPEIQDPESDDPDPPMRSFSFTYLGQEYTCADNDGDNVFTCEAVPPGQSQG